MPEPLAEKDCDGVDKAAACVPGPGLGGSLGKNFPTPLLACNAKPERRT